MTRTRRKIDPTLKGEGSTVVDLAKRYGVHPNKVYSGKAASGQRRAGLPPELGAEAEERSRREATDLNAKIGQLTVERHFGQIPQQTSDPFRVEVRPGVLGHVRPHRIWRPALLVRAVRGECVYHVGHCRDPAPLQVSPLL